MLRPYEEWEIEVAGAELPLSGGTGRDDRGKARAELPHSKLFVAEGGGGVELGSAAGGDVGGEQGDRREKCRYSCQS